MKNKIEKAVIEKAVQDLLATPLDSIEAERDRLADVLFLVRDLADALDKELREEYDWYIENSAL